MLETQGFPGDPNLPFIRWDEIIKDKALCSAIVDRLCHKAYLVNMPGPFYRVLETKNKC